MEMEKIRIGIVGGGIGGLTLAQLAKNSSLNAEIMILERDVSPESRDQGWFIGITSESAAVLSPLFMQNRSLEQQFSSADEDNSHSMFRMLDAKTHDVFFKVYGTGNFVDRQSFRQSLLQGLTVQWNHRFQSYSSKSSGEVDAVFSVEGVLKTYTFDILIGADGAQSAVRQQLCPQIRYADLGYVNIAGTSPYSAADPLIQQLTRGSGALNRWVGADGHTVMMFACRRQEASPQDIDILWVLSFPGSQSDWKGRFAKPSDTIDDEYSLSTSGRNELLDFCCKAVEDRFAPEVLKVLRNTPASTRLFGPRQIYSVASKDVKLLLEGCSGASTAAVVLLGDAAHATTTHRGLGANTAMKDAVDLLKSLHAIVKDKSAIKHADRRLNLLKHLHDYNKMMVTRGLQVINDSTASTRSIHSTGWEAAVQIPFMRVVGCILGLFVRPARDPLTLARLEVDRSLNSSRSWLARPTTVAVVLGAIAIYWGHKA